MRNLISILLFISIPLSSVSQNYNQIQKIINSDRASGDVFGYSVAISNNYAIVGAEYEDEDAIGWNTLANAGSAYVFEKDINGHWNQKQKIVPSDRTADDYFGGAVSIDGNIAIIGAFDKNAFGGNTFSHAGAAYIFERDVNGNWNEMKKIVASDTGTNDHFGYTVSISGNHVIIGSPIDAEDSSQGNTLLSAGSVYFFERDGSGNWNQTQKVVAADRAAADLFGTSVSISGDYAIVGAYQEDENPLGGNTISNAGSAYIFERDGNGVWNQKQKIVSSDRAISDRFGISVSISGSYAIVGAYLEDENETGINFRSAAGSAYIFERSGSGIWAQTKKITAPDRDPNDYFGQAVYINGNLAIVGAQNESADAQGGNSMASAGAAYIFKRNGSGNWALSQKMVASDRANSDFYGFSVAISNDYAFIGAYLEDEDLSGGNSLNGAGSVYIAEACHSTSSTFNKSVCKSYISPSGNHIWTSAGTYLDTITNATGCDSIMSIHLNLNNSLSSFNKTACHSYTSPSGHNQWTHSDTYLDTIPNAKGCDSVMTIHLTINNSSSTLNETTCSSYTSPSGHYTWTHSNTYMDTIPNAKGCDSVLTIHLTVKNSSSTITRIACHSYTSPSGHFTWTSSNTYKDTIPNSKGCDSIITIHLTINTLSTSSIINRTACISYISPSGKYSWATPGTYVDTIPNAASCDSIITIHLTINTISTSSTLNQTVCDSYTSPSGKHTWTSSNTYLDTIPNTEGCDSIITIHLSVKNTHSTIYETACHSFTSPSGNNTWTSSGIYMDTIPNGGGCDSIITIHLSINNSYSIINQTACYRYTSPSGNYTWTSSGSYIDTLPNTFGCDSIITIHLIVNTASTGILNQTACNSYTSPSGNYTWASSGIYIDTIPNFKDCDSVITIHLVVNTPSTGAILNQTACNSYTSPSGNYTWTSSGIYIDTIPNFKGCDSIITIHLIVYTSSTAIILNQTACNSYTSPSGNYTWTGSGIYIDTIPNFKGCDSIITIQLIVNTASFGPALNISACNTYTSPSGNYTWTSSNTYMDTIPNAKGCDSILTINLTITNITITVNQDGMTLLANSAGGSCQWLDCENGNSIITGADSALFIPVTNGQYAVKITENGCTDTSACYEIITVGLLDNNSENKILISPNPAKESITISFDFFDSENIVVELISSTGQIIYSQTVKNNTSGKYIQKIESNNLSNGLYFIFIQNGRKQLNGKFIIDN